LKKELRAFALDAGFVAMGVCRPDAIPQAAGRLAAFVDAGRHGDMGWMAERMAWRGDPAALMACGAVSGDAGRELCAGA